MIPGFYDGARELLYGQLSADEIERWLVPIGFSDWQETHRRLNRIAQRSGATPALADLLPYLLTMLSESGSPDRVLVNLERFLQSSTDMGDRLHWLSRNLRATSILTRLFAGSQYLTEILLRNPEMVELLAEPRALVQPRAAPRIELAAYADGSGERRIDPLDALRCYQRLELLRIGVCDMLALFDLPLVTGQLSGLADGVIRAALTLAAVEVSRETSRPLEGFVVLAMGKLGGYELNYSSDIDLLFLAEGGSDTHRQLGERLIDVLTRVTSEGFLYRVDMRLRPWGRSGPLVTSLNGYLSYLRKSARIWEKQALLKARIVAGDEALGQRFLECAMPIVYDVTPDAARASVSATKRLTESHLRDQGHEWGEVKLGQGSIRDIEFVVQYLQLSHGTAHPDIRSHNTLDALTRLSAAGLLAGRDSRILADGYIFLRVTEHYLQMMHYRQTHTLPEDEKALAQLAHRLEFSGQTAGEQFVQRYEQHRSAIRSVYLKFLGEQPMNTSVPEPRAIAVSRSHISRMDASYTTVFTEQEIQRHASLAGLLNRDNLAEVEAISLGDRRWRVTIVGYDYPGELSLICGLLFAYGCSIEEGQVFTYEPVTGPAPEVWTPQERRKIVDAFTVHAVHEDITSATWDSYALDLRALLERMHTDHGQEAHGLLARRVASAIATSSETQATLYPVDIEIDNDASEHYTVLNITAPDTIGFLYEFTNALAYSRVYIARVDVESFGNRAHDTLFVTDAQGRKITSPDRERELRAAVVLIKHFTHLLPHTPDPETALLHFREFIHNLFRQPNWPDEFASLENPEVLSRLARLLGVSDFLWDDFLRMQYANLFPVVRDADALDTSKSRAALQSELEAALSIVHTGPQSIASGTSWRNTLNAFKDREMFRIDMRHILGHTQEFWDFSEELTALAEVVVNAAFHLCHEDLRAQHGTPCTENGAISEMAVFALGKCGGHELGFASDIELLFVYSGNGRTTGPQTITTAEFYEKLVTLFLQSIEAKREGIFEIDLQLRPYGKAGSMAVALEAFRRYFAPEGPAWPYERQSLAKLRPIAGDRALGDIIVALRDQFVYAEDAFDVTAMRAMRERQMRHLVTGGTFNAKYSPGGLVDVEYLVQGLQIEHGAEHPSLRSTNIREAMRALAAEGFLSQDDYDRLRRAYTFLRWLIDGLRMVRGNAKDLTVPAADSEAIPFLARRMRYSGDAERLIADLGQHTAAVQELNRRLLGG
ncbi:MAG: glutamine synthetase adenylyltransferase [Anaerolineae bacterium]|jgi:glutamate-ammonia-ligase adenylyltransferase|nr:glutamine synthetase adenylyltransferase [Anaerolineae bacterium]